MISQLRALTVLAYTWREETDKQRKKHKDGPGPFAC